MNNKNDLLLLKLVSFLLLSNHVVLGREEDNVGSSSYACDFYNDVCPFQMNGKCNDPVSSSSRNNNDNNDDDDMCSVGNGDCVDCDPCQAYHYDCASCIDNGCHWCAGNAFCSSIPLPQVYFNHVGSQDGSVRYTECSQVQDWTTTTCSSLAIEESRTVEHDPLYNAQQWVYDSINVERVWNEYNLTGKGIHIRINDDGIDIDHAEFSDKFDRGASCTNASLPIDDEKDTHGTAVASIAAGNANNNVCATGIAPGATLSSCNLLALQQQLQDEENNNNNKNKIPIADALSSESVRKIDISSNTFLWKSSQQPCRKSHAHTDDDDALTRRRFLQSMLRSRHIIQDNEENIQQQTVRMDREEQEEECPFPTNDPLSPCDACDFSADGLEVSTSCFNAIRKYCTHSLDIPNSSCTDYFQLFSTCDYLSLSTEDERVLRRGIQRGRNGKGILYVFPSGDDASLGSDTNGNGWLQSRYTISAGAVGRQQQYVSSYSTGGSALMVSAPGGDSESLTNHIVAQNGGGCTSPSPSTSYATATVTGVLALLLESNPALTWRDVQGILASTSRRIELDNNDIWTVNGANYHHSYVYGFGMIDAYEAVTAAQTWDYYNTEVELSNQPDRNLNLPIVASSSSSNTITTTLAIEDPLITGNGTLSFFTETVYVTLKVIHESRGNLKIILTSPSGTESILHPGKRSETSRDRKWRLMTVRNWGEDPLGTWTLSITDDVGNYYYDNNKNINMESVANLNTNIMRSIEYENESTNSNENTNMLKSWEIVVHGHYTNKVVTAPSSTTASSSTSPPTTLTTTRTSSSHTVTIHNEFIVNCKSKELFKLDEIYQMFITELYLRLEYLHGDAPPLEYYYNNENENTRNITATVTLNDDNYENNISSIQDFSQCEHRHHEQPEHEQEDEHYQHCKNVSASYDITVHIAMDSDNTNIDGNHDIIDILLFYEHYYIAVTQHAIHDGLLEGTILQMYPTSNIALIDVLDNTNEDVEEIDDTLANYTKITRKDSSSNSSSQSSILADAEDNEIDEIYDHSEVVIFAGIAGAFVLTGLICVGIGALVKKFNMFQYAKNVKNSKRAQNNKPSLRTSTRTEPTESSA